MSSLRRLQVVNQHIREIREEIETCLRIENELGLKLAKMEVIKAQLEDEVCINVEEEQEDNSIDQDKKYVLPNLHYRVVSDDEEEGRV